MLALLILGWLRREETREAAPPRVGGDAGFHGPGAEAVGRSHHR
jgi:hypothetical protein